MIGFDFLIFFGSIQEANYSLNTILFIIQFIFVILFFLLDVAWLHYKIQHVIMGIYKLFMDLRI